MGGRLTDFPRSETVRVPGGATSPVRRPPGTTFHKAPMAGSIGDRGRFPCPSRNFWAIRNSIPELSNLQKPANSIAGQGNPIPPPAHRAPCAGNRGALAKFGGFQIDDQLELGRTFDRQIGGFGAFENLVHQAGILPVVVRQARRRIASIQRQWGNSRKVRNRVDHGAAAIPSPRRVTDGLTCAKKSGKNSRTRAGQGVRVAILGATMPGARNMPRLGLFD
jgi:hypothetical protein